MHASVAAQGAWSSETVALDKVMTAMICHNAHNQAFHEVLAESAAVAETGFLVQAPSLVHKLLE